MIIPWGTRCLCGSPELEVGSFLGMPVEPPVHSGKRLPSATFDWFDALDAGMPVEPPVHSGKRLPSATCHVIIGNCWSFLYAEDERKVAGSRAPRAFAEEQWQKIIASECELREKIDASMFHSVRKGIGRGIDGLSSGFLTFCGEVTAEVSSAGLMKRGEESGTSLCTTIEEGVPASDICHESV